MQAVKAYYDGKNFVPVESVKVKRNQYAIITILDEIRNFVTDEKPFIKYVGALSGESFNEITEALEDTQRVDANEW